MCVHLSCTLILIHTPSLSSPIAYLHRYFGKATGASKHFQAAAGKTLPPLYNPADFFLDLLSPDYRSKELERSTLSRVKQLGDAWSSKEAAAIAAQMKGLAYNEVSLVPDVPSCFEVFDSVRLVRNFRLLCWRAAMEQTREVPTLVIKFVITVVFGLIIAGVFQNITLDQVRVSCRLRSVCLRPSRVLLMH